MKLAFENSQLRFSIRLLIRHPTLHPQLVTRKLNLEPDRQLVAGEPFQPPFGDYVGGPNRMSSWSKSYEYGGKRRFFEEIGGLLDLLETEEQFISEIHETGGEVQIIFNLSGMNNIGDTLALREMERCARLHVKVGVEVFPDF